MDSAPATSHGASANLSSASDHQWLKDFTEKAGPLLHSKDSTPTDIFSHFFSADLTDILVRETNRYATESIAKSQLGPYSHAHQWTDVTKSDVNGFLALLILQSVVKLPKNEMYWTTISFVELPGIRSLMARDRFELIMVALCNTADHYIFILFLLSFFLLFFSSPNLSSRRLDVYHTSAHGVVLV